MTTNTHIYLQLENFLNSYKLASTKITLLTLQRWIKENSKSLKSHEKTWIRQLISFADVSKPCIDTLEFLRFKKNQRKQSNTRQAQFYFKCFKSMGCHYRSFLIVIGNNNIFLHFCPLGNKKKTLEKDAYYKRTSLS